MMHCFIHAPDSYRDVIYAYKRPRKEAGQDNKGLCYIVLTPSKQELSASFSGCRPAANSLRNILMLFTQIKIKEKRDKKKVAC